MKTKVIILMLLLLIIAGCTSSETKKVQAEVPAYWTEVARQTSYGSMMVTLVDSQGHVIVTYRDSLVQIK